MAGIRRKRYTFTGGAGQQISFPATKRRRRVMARIRATPRVGYTRTSGNYGRFRAGGTEKKWFDSDFDEAVVATTAEISLSKNLIAQGTGESNRIGRKCTVKAINLRYEITLPATTVATTGDIVRVILVLDKQANGVMFTGSTVLQTNTEYMSYRGLDNSNRVVVLMDRYHVINHKSAAGDATGVDTNTETAFYKFHKKVNIPLEFSDTTGAITEIRSNNIGILVISGFGRAGFKSHCRLRFVG